MMKRKSIIIFSILIVSVMISAFCFDWPQDDIESDNFMSFFSKSRGGTINNSIVFANSQNPTFSEDGKVIAVISEHSEDGWFESTLGNAVIVAHKDSLLTVYGNLDDSREFQTTTDVKKGMELGSTGNSGWQKGNSFLEFQIIDVKTNTFINPRMLMPRVSENRQLILSDIRLIDKAGKVYSMQTQRTIPAGSYRLYIKQQTSAMLYKSRVLINGSETDSITYDTLKSVNGKLCVKGNSYYPKEIIYPDNDSQFAGEVLVPHGKNTLTVTIANILEEERSLTYNIIAY